MIRRGGFEPSKSALTRAFNLAAAPPAGFTDTAGNTHQNDIDALHAAGITVGCKTDPLSYCPTAPSPAPKRQPSCTAPSHAAPADRPTPHQTYARTPCIDGFSARKYRMPEPDASADSLACSLGL